MSTVRKAVKPKVPAARKTAMARRADMLVKPAKQAVSKKAVTQAVSLVVGAKRSRVTAATISVVELPVGLQTKMNSLADAGVAFMARFKAAR